MGYATRQDDSLNEITSAKIPYDNPQSLAILSPSPTDVMETPMKETLIPLIALSVIPAVSFAQNFPMTYGNSDQIITVPPVVSTFTTLDRNDRAYARRQLLQQQLRTKSRR